MLCRTLCWGGMPTSFQRCALTKLSCVPQFEADGNAYGVKRIARTSSNASSLDTVGTEYTDGDSSVAATEDSRYVSTRQQSPLEADGDDQASWLLPAVLQRC